MAIINDIKQKYIAGSMLMRIIYINIAVFVVLRLIGLFSVFFTPAANGLFEWIEVSSNPTEVLHKPWTLITYAFAHYDVLHIVFNMMWLYWLGRIFTDYFTSKQLAGLYILGALGGAAMYLLVYNFVPAFKTATMWQPVYMLGASASVLAIVVAMAVYNPDYKIGLLFIGDVSLKWVALITVLIDLLGSNSVNIAHLGGALVGVLFAVMMRRGRDITAPLNAVIDKVISLFTRNQQVVDGPGAPIGGQDFRRGNASQGPTEGDLDRVLAKIKRSGYASLTDAERDILFKFGRKR